MSFEFVESISALFEKDSFGIIRIFSIIFTALLFDFFQKRVLRHIQNKLEKTTTLWDDALVHALLKPVSLLIWVFGLSFALDILALNISSVLRELGLIITIAWTLIRFITFAEKNILYQHEIAGKPLDKTTANAVSQLLRVSVLITTVLVALQSLGINISAILAFGGIGGIAVGFAAKDLLANFFGGMMIYLDRPFNIGDWVRSNDRDIEGVVERIGWRTTVVRTFDKRPLYVPNAVFASISVENPSRMSHRRIYETIGVRYDDVKAIPSIINDIKNMLMAHADIDQTQTMIVNFNSFAASSLDFFIYTFTKTTDWIEYHKIKQDVLLKVSDIISLHKAEVAFPTSTIHIPDEVNITNLQNKE
ncbi:MAG: mechanosensitive ion channel family protein [Gammaproteobacteria bacterium]|nr:mechanosensitive ion channel family protein [Gammaproteobacteria bacterium]